MIQIGKLKSYDLGIPLVAILLLTFSIFSYVRSSNLRDRRTLAPWMFLSDGSKLNHISKLNSAEFLPSDFLGKSWIFMVQDQTLPLVRVSQKKGAIKTKVVALRPLRYLSGASGNPSSAHPILLSEAATHCCHFFSSLDCLRLIVVILVPFRFLRFLAVLSCCGSSLRLPILACLLSFRREVLSNPALGCLTTRCRRRGWISLPRRSSPSTRALRWSLTVLSFSFSLSLFLGMCVWIGVWCFGPCELSLY